MGVKQIAIAVVALASLTGCGGHGSSGYADASAVAKAAGCSKFKSDSPELYAADAGTCTYKGHYTDVEWFKDATSLNSWWKFAQGVGGGEMLKGTNWVVQCDQKSDCDSLHQRLGGTLG